MKKCATISFEPDELEWLKTLVEKGLYKSVSDAVRACVDDVRRRRKIEIPLEDCEQ